MALSADRASMMKGKAAIAYEKFHEYFLAD
jgi:hypothetical protein